MDFDTGGKLQKEEYEQWYNSNKKKTWCLSNGVSHWPYDDAEGFVMAEIYPVIFKQLLLCFLSFLDRFLIVDIGFSF